MNSLKVKRLKESAVLPVRATEGSAGADLCACLDCTVEILPGETAKIPTGIAIDIGSCDKVALVFGRSGLGINHGIAPANCVGVIDSDYRGEIIVGLKNSSGKPYSIHHGDRIAQLVIMPVFTPKIEEVTELGETDRGTGGFGSTGR